MATVPTLVSYFPKPGQCEALLEMVLGHYPVLKRLGLASPTPPRVFRAWNKDTGAPYVVELFEWASEEASDIAHQTPEVMVLWEGMGEHIETMTLARVEAVEPRVS